MTALVRMLARLARSAPVAVVLVTVLLTAVFGAFAGRAVQDQSQESFSPDNEELAALQFAAETFEGSTETLVQVLVRGGDVVSVAGLVNGSADRRGVQAWRPPGHVRGGDRRREADGRGDDLAPGAERPPYGTSITLWALLAPMTYVTSSTSVVAPWVTSGFTR